MTPGRLSSARLAFTALGLLLGSQLLMGDAIAPGCCNSHSNYCADNRAIALTFAVSGDCSAPGTVQISSAAGSCDLAVDGHPAWKSGTRDPGSSIGSGKWYLLLASDDACLIKASASAPDEYSVTCDRLDGGTCTSVLGPAP